MIGTRYFAGAVAAAVACIASVSIANTAVPSTQKQALLRGLALPTKAAPAEQTISRLIVKFREGTGGPAASSLARAAQASKAGAAAGLGLDHVRELAAGASLLAMKAPLPLSEARAAAARLARDPTVEYAVPDIMMKRMAVPSDGQYLRWQWNLFAPATMYDGSKISNGAPKSATAIGGANLPPAWDVVPDASSVVVAIIDTGIVNHPDLNGIQAPAPYAPDGRLLAGYDFISSDVGASDGLPANFVANDGGGRDNDPTDPGDWVTTVEEATYPLVCDDGIAGPQDSSWHGTHMAGLAGATWNFDGIAGAARNVKILPLRALGKCGGALSDIAEAIRWAAGLPVPGLPPNPAPAQVISLSLGGGDCRADPFMQSAVTEATNAGAVVVAATGNDGTIDQVIAPANCDGAIGITAHTINGENADYANIGAGSAISAPGGGSPTLLGAGGATDDGDWTGYYLWSTLLYGATDPNSSDSQGQSGPGYGGFTGTSPATPQVAGVVALMKSVRPEVEARSFMRPWLTMASSVRPHPAGGFCETQVQDCGSGLLDAGKALQAALDRVPAVSVSTASRIVAPGALVTFTGSVTAYPGRTAAGIWSVSGGGTLSGTTGPSVILTAPATGFVTVTLAGTDSAGKTAFDAIKIRVNTPPALGATPGRTATVGQTVSFTVTATDPDGDPISFFASSLPAGASLSPTGQFSWNTMGAATGTYQLVYQASDGVSSTQGTVTITLLPGVGPPVIISAPLSATVTEGQVATFGVQVTGAAPLSYQWRRNGVAISGATSFTYTTPPAVATDSGAQFAVTVTNSSGTATSISATLTVVSGGAPPPVGGGGGGALPFGQWLLLAALALAARIHRRK